MSGRTSWWAKDSGWWRREGVVLLQEECGLLGPAAVDWLTCEAKSQNDGGVVKSGYRTIAKALDSDVVTVCHALSRAVHVGLLDDFEEAEHTFTCRISGWKEEQDKRLASERKAKQREREAAEKAMNADESPNEASGQTVTGHVLSRPVTECHLQDRTGQLTATSDEASADVLAVFDAWAASRSAAAGRQSTVKLDTKRRRLIRAALKSHGLDDVLAAVQGWQQSPHHRGENQGRTVYNDLGLLLRDADHIERFRDLHLSASGGASVHQITETQEQRRKRLVAEANARNARFDGGTPA